MIVFEITKLHILYNSFPELILILYLECVGRQFVNAFQSVARLGILCRHLENVFLCIPHVFGRYHILGCHNHHSNILIISKMFVTRLV